MRDRLLSLVHVHPALHWFADGQFVFLGAIDAECGDRRRRDAASRQRPRTAPRRRRRNRRRGQLPDVRRAGDPAAVMTRADAISTVFRPQRLTVLIVSDPDEPGSGRPEGPSVQHRFVGLLSTAAQRASVLDIPGFGDQISQRARPRRRGHPQPLRPGGADRPRHLPRDVVLELSPSGVADLVREIVGLQERRLVRVFEVPEPVGLWTTVLVFLPRNRFTAELPERIADIVAAAYGSRAAARSSRSSSARARSPGSRSACGGRRPTLAPTSTPSSGDRRAVDVVERPLAARRSSSELGEVAGHRVFDLVGQSASAAYRAAVSAGARRGRPPPHRGGDRPAQRPRRVARPRRRRPGGEWRIRVYRLGTPMALSELLPLLDHLGFVALDEQPYTFQVGAERVHLYDIGVRIPAGASLDARRGGRRSRGVHRARARRRRERRLQPPRAARRPRRP